MMFASCSSGGWGFVDDKHNGAGDAFFALGALALAAAVYDESEPFYSAICANDLVSKSQLIQA
jgi:hypothetical protein